MHRGRSRGCFEVSLTVDTQVAESPVFPFLHLPDMDAWRPNAVNGWGIVVRVIGWVEPVAFWALALTLGAMFTRLLTRDRD
jgi:hypothetical protein